MKFEEAKAKLEVLSGNSKFEKMVGFCSIFTELMSEHQIKPVIVGGLAVEIYSRSEYTTVDIDLVFSRRDLANEYLIQLGFTKLGRHWLHENLGISVEIPGDMLNLADPDRVVKLNLPHDLHIFVIGLEDIILDRLRACVHWTSTSDCEWGKRLYLLHHKRVDESYLLEKAAEDLTLDKMKKWIREKESL